jgi:uncharacterized protein (DUF983 family)
VHLLQIRWVTVGGTGMHCKKCKGELEVLRMCRKIRMRCRECEKEYQIHEVADQLDSDTEELLERYTAIIYD